MQRRTALLLVTSLLFLGTGLAAFSLTGNLTSDPAADTADDAVITLEAIDGTDVYTVTADEIRSGSPVTVAGRTVRFHLTNDTLRTQFAMDQAYRTLELPTAAVPVLDGRRIRVRDHTGERRFRIHVNTDLFDELRTTDDSGFSIASSEGDTDTQTAQETQSYIVEATAEPLLPKKQEITAEVEAEKQQVRQQIQTLKADETRNTAKIQELENRLEQLDQERRQRIKEHTDRIQTEQLSILSTIRRGVNRSVRSNRFTQVFNGIRANLTPQQAAALMDKSAVAAVHRDRQVSVNLNNTVHIVNASTLWNRSHNGSAITGDGVRIAIIDTGVDYTHGDLGSCSSTAFLNGNCDKVVGGYDVYNDDEDPMDNNGHGTHVAATAAGNGTLDGVAPGADILAYKVLSGGGSGTYADVIGGVEQAVNDSADIVSLSLGGPGTPDSPVSKAIDNAVESGVVATVAAGNDGPYRQTIGSPGTARRAITVGATDDSDELAWFSSRGPVVWKNGTLSKPDLVAPGVEVCAARWDSAFGDTCIDDKHASISGTSMATPHVAGAAALLLQRHPTWTPDTVKSTLMLGSTVLPNYSVVEQGAGRLDVARSINMRVTTEPASLHATFEGTDPVGDRTVTFRNLGDAPVRINATIRNATDTETGGNATILTRNGNTTFAVTVPPNDRTAVNLTYNMTGNGGTYFGRMMLQDNTSTGQYVVPYIGRWTVRVNVTAAAPNRALEPWFYATDRGLNVTRSASADSNTTSMVLPPNRNYTFYALGLLEHNESYVLYEEHPVTASTDQVYVNLSAAREYHARGRGLSGDTIDMYDWTMKIVTYPDVNKSFSTSLTAMNMQYGNQTVHISNKPDNALNTDVMLKYNGVPQ